MQLMPLYTKPKWPTYIYALLLATYLSEEYLAPISMLKSVLLVPYVPKMWCSNESEIYITTMKLSKNQISKQWEDKFGNWKVKI